MRYAIWIVIFVAVLSFGIYAVRLHNNIKQVKPRVVGVRLAEYIEFSEIDFDVKDITQLGTKFRQIDLDIDIEFVNFGTKKFSIYQINLDVLNEENGQVIAQIREPLSSKFEIKPNATTPFALPIRVNTIPLLEFVFKGSLEALAKLYAGIPTGKNIRVRGTARIENNIFNLPINQVIKI